MAHLITLEEFKTLARPASIHLEASLVEAYITEAEDKHIIPAIGYETYKILTTTEAENLTEEQTILLGGGEYTGAVCDCTVTEALQRCKGLKVTTAYFAYARMLRADGAIISRAGFMQHEDQYSQHYDDSSKAQYNDVMDMAETYLSSCLSYLKTIQPDTKPVRGSRARIYAIGD